MKNKGILPSMDYKRNIVFSPHVVILGAGASRASCPNGDKNGLKLPLMKDLIKIIELEKVLDEWKIDDDRDDFELLYDKITKNSKLKALLKIVENKVYKYFSRLQIPDEVNVYDKILLSLRPKDLIATFNWDPFLAQAYKRNRLLRALPQIIFLHGNVEVGICEQDKVNGFLDDICRHCGSPFEPTKLLYPITNKNYSEDPFIHSEWTYFENFLENAYFITIFGYSAPKTDAEAIRVMKEKWQANPSQELGEIDIIDIKKEEELNKTWEEFFVRQHFSIVDQYEQSFMAHYPRRSCEALAGATLHLTPWNDKPLPDTKSLSKLQKAVQNLIEEEEKAEKKQESFKRWI